MEKEAHDFSNDEEENNVIAVSDGANITAVADSSIPSSFSNTGVSTFHGDVQYGTSFSGDLCVPSDELEWMSNFVDDSFSAEQVQKLQLVSGYKTRPESGPEPGPKNPNSSTPVFTTDVSVPAKAMSKRPRAAACDWASHALPEEAFYDDPFTGETIISSLYLSPPSSPTSIAQLWKKQAEIFQRKKEALPLSGADERRCLCCATNKTVQWRTGPMGPKTLCNACGVRYITGRMVPVARPTFVMTKHSNAYWKVMELRRQKAMTKSHHEFGKDTAMILDVSSDGDEYLIGPMPSSRRFWTKE